MSRSPTSGKLLEQLGHEPEQERGVEARIVHQLVGRQDVDDAAPVAVGAHQVLDVERGLAEELVALLVLEHEELALDRADGLLRHVAVGRRERLGVLGDELQQRAQILQVEQQQPLLVGDAERDVEHALLRVVEIEQAREQQRSHLGDRGADAVALLAEEVPEHDRESVRHVVDADLLGALDERRLAVAGRRRRRRDRP